MLPDLINRDRTPRVGITASFATISLRVTASASNEQGCLDQMQPTIETIRNELGDLIFGENGAELPQVVVEHLQRQRMRIAIVDFGLNGAVAQSLSQYDSIGRFLAGSLQLTPKRMNDWLGANHSAPTGDLLKLCGQKILEEISSDIGVAIGPIEKTPDRSGRQYQLAICKKAEFCNSHTFHYGGHSALRDARSRKQVLNQIRLMLQNHG